MTIKKIREFIRLLSKKDMLVNLLLGFSSGLPLLLTSRTLQLWLSYKGASNVLIGTLALIGLPYSLKPLWSPILDRYKILPLGRRRGWLLLTQIGVFAAIWLMSTLNPVQHIQLMLFYAVLLAFMSASQDTVIDAYRREILADEEQGLGASYYNMGYRIAMWVTGGLAVILAGQISWNMVYKIVSIGMAVGLITTFFADEPTVEHVPKTLKQAVILPFREFLQRDQSVIILLFILFYHLGDAMAGNMFSKFYVQLGFTPTEIGVVAKSFTPFSVTIGGFLSGVLILRWGTFRSLFAFGIFQAISTALYSLLDVAGHSIPVLALVVFSEDFATGMNATAMIAYLSLLSDRKFTATQYALFVSLTNIPRVLFSSMAGYFVDLFGFFGFFIFCACLALPGLVILYYLNRTAQKTAATA